MRTAILIPGSGPQGPSKSSAGTGLHLLGRRRSGYDLKFDVMTPVTGPYVGTSNPIRMVPGGGLPWMITAGTGLLTRDGRLQIHVRGLVLADNPAVPANLRGTNPIPDFEAIVSCQSISGTNATVTNVATGRFRPHQGKRRHQGQGDAAAAVHCARRVRRLTHRRLVRSDRKLSRRGGRVGW